MNRPVLATRTIGIDMGHRVTNHKSKCRNLHGHRYTIECAVRGKTQEAGSGEGMVEDFGDLKALMMEEIDGPCDHGTCLWVQDPLVINMVRNGNLRERPDHGEGPFTLEGWPDVLDTVNEYGGLEVEHQFFGKMYLLADVPTAENLARHWYNRLSGRLVVRYVKVWETPNCWAQYPAEVG